MRWLIATLMIAPLPALAETVAVPSGQPVRFVEMLQDPNGSEGLTLRFRFLAPQIARDTGSVSIDAALEDIDSLCADFAAIEVANMRPQPEQIVISLMDRLVDFGATNPDATQFFEAYRIEDGTCIWEGL